MEEKHSEVRFIAHLIHIIKHGGIIENRILIQLLLVIFGLFVFALTILMVFFDEYALKLNFKINMNRYSNDMRLMIGHLQMAHAGWLIYLIILCIISIFIKNNKFKLFFIRIIVNCWLPLNIFHDINTFYINTDIFDPLNMAILLAFESTLFVIFNIVTVSDNNKIELSYIALQRTIIKQLIEFDIFILSLIGFAGAYTPEFWYRFAHKPKYNDILIYYQTKLGIGQLTLVYGFYLSLYYYDWNILNINYYAYNISFLFGWMFNTYAHIKFSYLLRIIHWLAPLGMPPYILTHIYCYFKCKQYIQKHSKSKLTKSESISDHS